MIALRMAGVWLLFGRWALKEWMIKRRLEKNPKFRKLWTQRQERYRSRAGGDPAAAPTRKEMVLVGWAGMRGILTLAAAGAIPEHTTSGAPFPGRDAIQAIALLVTLGTLLLQGTTITMLTRWLKFDLVKERADDEALREEGRSIAAAVPADLTEDMDAYFEKQRHALGEAVMKRTINEEVARDLIEDIDLRQAARHAGA